jgi:hypothetical protein
MTPARARMTASQRHETVLQAALIEFAAQLEGLAAAGESPGSAGHDHDRAGRASITT